MQIKTKSTSDLSVKLNTLISGRCSEKRKHADLKSANPLQPESTGDALAVERVGLIAQYSEGSTGICVVVVRKGLLQH